MPKVYLDEVEKDRARIERRMDRFDQVVTEYLRRNHYTAEDLSFQVKISPSTLWRGRKRPQYFATAPFATVTKILKVAGCTQEALRYICGHDK